MVFTKKLVRISPEFDWYSHQWPQDGKMWYVTAVLVKIKFFPIVPSAGPYCNKDLMLASCYPSMVTHVKGAGIIRSRGDFFALKSSIFIQINRNLGFRDQMGALMGIWSFVEIRLQEACHPRIQLFLTNQWPAFVKTPTSSSIQLKTTSTAVGFDTIMTVHTTPPPPHHHHRNSTPCQELLQDNVS